jgi:IS30 family transposase
MRCYSHLSDDEREQIGLVKALGHSAIRSARSRKRSAVRKSTISRELSAISCGPYLAVHAARAYQLRREALIERDRALPTFVVDRLAEGWTPEQIWRW